MLNSTEKNPELTFEQLQSIDLVQKRLSNLESEIAIAAKNLVIEKKEIVKATKEREYQEELLNKLNEQIPSLEAKRDKIEDDIKAGEERLVQIAEKDRETKAKQASKESELNEREIVIKESEEKLSERQEELRKEIVLFDEAKEKLSEFKEELSRVISKW